MNTATANIVIVIAWGLTIALVSQILGGTFESGRSCQTTCVSVMYYGSIALALIGSALSFMQARKPIYKDSLKGSSKFKKHLNQLEKLLKT